MLLRLNSDYPLASLYHTKNLAKKIAEDQELEMKVSLSVDKYTAVLGSISVTLKGFGVMYRGLVAEIEQRQKELFGGVEFKAPEWFGFRVPEIIADDNNRSNPGYFFADHESNQEFLRYEDLGLRVLFEHPRLKGRYGCVRSSDQKLILNAIACQDFFQRANEIRTKLASACHISLGGPPRGSEFAANYLRNHPSGDIRNVRFVFSTLCFVSGYNKSSMTVSAPLYARTSTDKPNLDGEAKSDIQICPESARRAVPYRLAYYPADRNFPRIPSENERRRGGASF